MTQSTKFLNVIAGQLMQLYTIVRHFEVQKNGWKTHTFSQMQSLYSVTIMIKNAGCSNDEVTTHNVHLIIMFSTWSLK